MKKKKMKLDEAYDFVKKKRSIIEPNEGFLLELKKYEDFLFKDSN
jgi:hypothetical protein